MAGLEQSISKRLDAVVQALLQDKLGGLRNALLRMILWVPLKMVRDRALAWIMETLRREYAKFDV